MTTVFSGAYANQYDRLYQDKDYSGECDLIEEGLRLYGKERTRRIIDFGCGTGNHSFPLAERGYDVTGVDLSADMLEIARRKSVASDVRVEFVQGDIRNVQIEGVFDAGLVMFAVLGYLLSNEDLMSALNNVRRYIRPGGLLLFDIWYGPAVLTIRPTDRAKVIPTSKGQIIRLVTSQLDTRRHLCQVRYHLWQLNGDRVEARSEELHTMRFFFPMELEMMLAQANFILNSLTAFPGLDHPADETTWNAFGVAQAV